jgi:hypothetical protein
MPADPGFVNGIRNLHPPTLRCCISPNPQSALDTNNNGSNRHPPPPSSSRRHDEIAACIVRYSRLSSRFQSVGICLANPLAGGFQPAGQTRYKGRVIVAHNGRNVDARRLIESGTHESQADRW